MSKASASRVCAQGSRQTKQVVDWKQQHLPICHARAFKTRTKLPGNTGLGRTAAAHPAPGSRAITWGSHVYPGNSTRAAQRAHCTARACRLSIARQPAKGRRRRTHARPSVSDRSSSRARVRPAPVNPRPEPSHGILPSPRPCRRRPPPPARVPCAVRGRRRQRFRRRQAGQVPRLRQPLPEGA